ncbi:CapA family protein [Bacillus horti]|uniref:Poly-gamma-glutamate synthesis protein (Capsule biosynthesis protein) n=1 Tax=Caldalkalibacillus horti TaxID=77523 RepID=A0ABT9VXR2_9BACI|nr:CapA family protein [Bacillus horti]MDQ0165790.1 poly-gamma-glutamate synthesis protein (capsule biosynthesis protein) [Bacillus horti]
MISYKKGLLLLILLTLVLSGCSLLQSDHSQDSNIPSQEELNQANGDEEKKGNIVEEEPIDFEPIVSKVTLQAVGDMLISDSIISDAQQSDGTYDFTGMVARIKPYLQTADLAIVNQETIIGGVDLGLSGYPMFNSPVEVADMLVDTGFHVATLANNHTLDRGEEGILNALAYYQTLDILTTGAYVSEEDRNQTPLIEINDIQFAVLNYSYGTNGIPVPENKEYLVNLIDKELIERDVKQAIELADVTIVAMHWGNEYEIMPNEEQIELAQFMSDLGVDIILGTHPHVLQPPDWLTGESGNQTFVAYSLGNFLSSQDRLNRLIGGVVGVDVTKTIHEDRTEIELAAPSFLVTYNYYSNWRNFELFPMDEVTEDRLAGVNEEYEQIQQHLRTFIPDLTIVQSKDF